MYRLICIFYTRVYTHTHKYMAIYIAKKIDIRKAYSQIKIIPAWFWWKETILKSRLKPQLYFEVIRNEAPSDHHPLIDVGWVLHCFFLLLFHLLVLCLGISPFYLLFTVAGDIFGISDKIRVFNSTWLWSSLLPK